MHTVTEYFETKMDEKTIKEGSWNNSPLNYSCFNTGGVECEVGEMLYGFVKTLQPMAVLETGTNTGIAGSYIAQALKDENRGKLTTLEFLPEVADMARERFKKLELEDWINLVEKDALKFTPEETYDLILLDTEPQTRFEELVRFTPFLNPGGFIFIHDLDPHMHQVSEFNPFGKVPDDMKELVTSHTLYPFHFRTPRGLTGFYKPHADAYDFYQ